MDVTKLAPFVPIVGNPSLLLWICKENSVVVLSPGIWVKLRTTMKEIPNMHSSLKMRKTPCQDFPDHLNCSSKSKKEEV